MERNYFSYYQKCLKTCNFWCMLKIPLSNFDKNGNSLLSKGEKKLYQKIFFFFLKFHEMALKETIVYLKRRQHVVKLRQQIYKERLLFEKRRNLSFDDDKRREKRLKNFHHIFKR